MTGSDVVRAVLREQLTPFEFWHVEPEQFVERGEEIVATVRTRVRPKGTTAEIENRNGHLWTFRDGLVFSLRIFPDPGEALEAIGMTE